MNSAPVSHIVKKEIAPGSELNTDGELLDWVRNNAETTYHPVGTCKMGNDTMAVVDNELKVHGIEQLRIADASIMPTLTSGNTNAPCIMIGEKWMNSTRYFFIVVSLFITNSKFSSRISCGIVLTGEPVYFCFQLGRKSGISFICNIERGVPTGFWNLDAIEYTCLRR